MARTLEEVMKSLPKARQTKIEQRAAKLLDEERLRQAPNKAESLVASKTRTD